MNFRRLRLGIIALAVLLGCGACVRSTQAAGVTVTPAFQEVTVTGRDGREVASFFLTNGGDTPQTYRLQAIDIDANNQSGGILLSGLDANFQIRYGLAKWLSFDQTEVTIGSQETKEIVFYVNNSEVLTPGGHYGAVLAQPTTGSQQVSDNKVSVSPQAAALVFVKKLGGETYGIKLVSTSVSSSVFEPPQTVQLLLENTGDVHVVPRGEVTIRDPFGREIARGAINTESGLVLPSRQRNFSVDLRSTRGGLRWPGKYTISVSYRFDGLETRETSEQQVWVINVWLVLSFAVLLLILGLCVNRYGYALGKRFRWLFQQIDRLKKRVRRDKKL